MPSATDYTGNAGLGLGANPDVPAIPDKDLDTISQTADRLQAQNAYQNHAIFQQKLKDRDKLMEAIDSGDIKVGDILEEDTEWVKEGLQKLDEAYFNRIKKGINDIDATREYNKAKREAQDRTTQAATRFVGDKAQAAAIAAETLPHKREAMIKNNQEWKKNKWGEVKPYQQTLDADFDIIKAYPKKVTTEKTDPRNPLMKIKETTVSVPATFQEADKDFKEGGKEMYNQMELLKQYQSMRPDELGAWLTAANNRLRPHGAEIKFLVDKETGQIVIEESIPNFSAKWSMATDPQLSASTSEVDRGALAVYAEQQNTRHDKAMEAIGRTNAAANARRANAYVALQNKKLSQLTEAEKKVKNLWSGIIGKVRSETSGDVVYAGDLPKGYTNINGLDENGKPIPLTPLKTSGGREYFGTRYFDSNGAATDPRTMYKQYIDHQRKSNSSVETYDALLQRLLNSGKINMELIGENGVGNFETAGQTSRAISNKGTTKGEDPIFYDDQQEE